MLDISSFSTLQEQGLQLKDNAVENSTLLIKKHHLLLVSLPDLHLVTYFIAAHVDALCF